MHTSTPQRSKRNKPKHYFGLSDNLYREVEADVLVRRQETGDRRQVELLRISVSIQVEVKWLGA